MFTGACIYLQALSPKRSSWRSRPTSSGTRRTPTGKRSSTRSSMSGRGTGSSRSASCSTRCAAKISLTFPGCLLNESFHIRNESTTKSSILRQICVNGSDQHPLFTWLKRQLPAPIDDADSLMSDPKFIQWSPVCRFVSLYSPDIHNMIHRTF